MKMQYILYTFYTLYPVPRDFLKIVAHGNDINYSRLISEPRFKCK